MSTPAKRIDINAAILDFEGQPIAIVDANGQPVHEKTADGSVGKPATMTLKRALLGYMRSTTGMPWLEARDLDNCYPLGLAIGMANGKLELPQDLFDTLCVICRKPKVIPAGGPAAGKEVWLEGPEVAGAVKRLVDAAETITKD